MLIAESFVSLTISPWNSNLSVVLLILFYFSADRIKIEQNAEPSFSTNFIQELFENQNETTTKKRKKEKNWESQKSNECKW